MEPTSFSVSLAALVGGSAFTLVLLLLVLLVQRRWLNLRHGAELTGLRHDLAAADQMLDHLRNDKDSAHRQLDSLRLQAERLREHAAGLGAQLRRLPELHRQVEEARELEQRMAAELREQGETLATLRAQRDSAEREASLRMEVLNEAKAAMGARFQQLAHDILDAKVQRFGSDSGEHIGQLLQPLRQQIEQFQSQVQQVYGEEARQRAALAHELGSLQKLNQQLSSEAHNLSRALSGQAKTRGQWGEMAMQRILEAAGLQAGRSFRLQVSLRDEHGALQQPDCVVDMPDGRSLIIDAKLNLLDYQRHVAASDEEAAQHALRAHCLALRRHVKELSAKAYQRLEGLQTLDFVVMFIPLEAAFIDALSHDDGLCEYALQRNVVLASPTTLIATLRTVASLWRIDDRNRNAEQIARKAGALYDKFVAFVEEIDRVAGSMDQAQRQMQTARERLGSGKGNLIRRAEELKSLGARTSRALSSERVEESMLAPELRKTDSASVQGAG